MRSQTTPSFRKALADLPSEIQERARKAFELFSEDPSHPSLRFKKVHSSRPIYSARITRDYRDLLSVKDRIQDLRILDPRGFWEELR